jgi:hypothetical protein
MAKSHSGTSIELLPVLKDHNDMESVSTVARNEQPSAPHRKRCTMIGLYDIWRHIKASRLGRQRNRLHPLHRCSKQLSNRKVGKWEPQTSPNHMHENPPLESVPFAGKRRYRSRARLHVENPQREPWVSGDLCLRRNATSGYCF